MLPTPFWSLSLYTGAEFLRRFAALIVLARESADLRKALDPRYGLPPRSTPSDYRSPQPRSNDIGRIVVRLSLPRKLAADCFERRLEAAASAAMRARPLLFEQRAI
jgi:hypothetical protein